MHLIEDHAQNAGIPVRFAASKLAEGDEEIEARLNLDTNEKETLEHIICQMEKERGLDRAAAIAGPSERTAPITLNVSQNTRPMIAINAGIAV